MTHKDEQPFYYHADFPGNPRKKGIINVSEVPQLPIKYRDRQIASARCL